MDTIIWYVIIDFLLDAWDWFWNAAARLTGIQFVLILAIAYLAFDRDEFSVLVSSIAAFAALIALDYRMESLSNTRKVKRNSAIARGWSSKQKSLPFWLRSALIGTSVTLVSVLVLLILGSQLRLASIMLVIVATVFIALRRKLAFAVHVEQAGVGVPLASSEVDS